MKKEKPIILTLSNGLRIVIRQSDGNVSYIGVAVNAGSRDDPADREGLAHFLEHTIFKGTKHRKSWHISNRLESIGGELNAYTSKEETLIYTNSPAGNAERAIELLADIIADSIFPEHELRKEQDVVIEEIKSYLDSPADAVFDIYEELIYAGSALAHNILGTPESVRSLRGSDCRGFLDTRYTPDNMVIYAVDPGSPARIERLMERYFGRLHFTSSGLNRVPPEVVKQFDRTIDENGHQAHTIMGTRLFGRQDPRRYALFLLNNHLGGPCMNSRLNQEIRERRGLAYTVDSNVALLSDTGTFNIYIGSDREMVQKCTGVVRRELDRLAQAPMSERLFNRIREQYRGQLLVSTDHREAAAMSLGKSLLYYNEVYDAAYTADRIMQVTREDLLEMARLIASHPLNRLTLQ
ncbi:MAG: insulinase family protein [Muribaculaceae bacterium]|nr:insulinase family protein [Muribaculaceae bacterium]